jgi:YbbR domain-containing protein
MIRKAIQRLLKNIWLKVASFMMAVILWATVVMLGQSVGTVEVPVNFKNVGEGLIVADPGGRSVVVSFKGHERIIPGLGPEDFSVSIDMTDKGAGRHSYEINPSDVSSPPMVRIVGVKPSLLNLRVDETFNKTLPVRAVVTGAPQRGHAMRGIEVMPKEVRAEGLKSELSGVRWIDTDPVDIAGARSDVAEEVRLESNGKGFSLSHDTVTVKVIIVKE